MIIRSYYTCNYSSVCQFQSYRKYFTIITIALLSPAQPDLLEILA